MYLLPDGALVTSASDLKLASECEFAFLRTLDAKLGRLESIPEVDDPMLERAARLGDQHEERVAQAYERRRPGSIIEIERPEVKSREALRSAAAATADALRAGGPIVYQGVFFDERDPRAPFLGFADFLVVLPDGRVRVQDAKLARSAKVTALLQLAAYHEQLGRLGFIVDDTVELLLGDGSSSEHRIGDIRPVFEARRARLRSMIGEHLAEPDAVAWGDPRYTAEGRCEHCEAEVVTHRDLFLVAGMRAPQRAKLREAGIATLDALAAVAARPEGCRVPETTYATLHAQAVLQASAPVDADPHAAPPYEFFGARSIADLPAPDAGDIYFDFEGDPLYREPGNGERESLWGIDYLFGWVDDAEQYSAIWAHDLVEERGALLRFLDAVRLRREQHPGVHIYHYAPYERTHLASIAARNGVGEQAVDELLRDGVLVDLYPVVKRSLRIGGRSYSIKKLEPLYMGDEHREQETTNGADSVLQYQSSRDALAAGDPRESQRILDDIADYNRYDCVSTRRLRNWILARAAERGVVPGTGVQAELRQPDFQPDPVTDDLLRLAESSTRDGDVGSADVYRLAAAAIDYHRREAKTFWWDHFARLEEPRDTWADTRGVFAVDRGRVVSPWQGEGSPRRRIRLEGVWAPGSGVPKGDVFALYESPGPYTRAGRRPGFRLDAYAVIVPDDEGDETSVVIEERCPGDVEPWHELPVALTPGAPPRADNLQARISAWGRSVVAHAPGWPADAATDVLRRVPPRVRDGLEPMRSADDGIRAVVASLLRLDASYLAVQGPPGTGKTHLAAGVIAELVREHRWRIGVVAQSHKVVEHVLAGAVRAGCPAPLAAKAPSGGDGAGAYADEPFTELTGRNPHAAFAQEHEETGYVIGGTAWDLANDNRFRPGQLDLLVIDEAGQFSLAQTIAVASSAQRLLLLGDPQQLPQVSQGTHPAPIDASALGTVSDGHDVLPAELGYFLAESRRMHERVTRPVSLLAYDGRLRSHPITAERRLDGAAPGFFPQPVAHRDNSTSSPEEAAVVVALVRQHLGLRWTDPSAQRVDDPLTEADIIVVTPYNAQVEQLRRALDAIGLSAVRVGTVDKYQGQEAVVSIVSLAASSPDDVPRGLPFLLSRNRLNVAISRAQWSAHLVYSPRLTEHLPYWAEGVAELSRFLELVGDAPQQEPAPE